MEEAFQSDPPVIQFVNQMLSDAIRQGASDIHFEPLATAFRVRYRLDGLLHEVFSPPPTMAPRVIARIKVLANLDIAERRLPQDGSFKTNIFAAKSVDLRVSSCPTIYGEKIVVRILDQSALQLDIDALGFYAHQYQEFLHALHQPQGLILVTGPTGSGKSVTLYSALARLNKIEKNIVTVEDPVEIKLPGVNQVNINPKIGLSFATILRAFLRQDPDIIMVGEIRDAETAKIAISAAQTGHLVLSTLHTNSAVETLTRLLNMGIPADQLTDSISLIISQRLLRRICEVCSAAGCNRCYNGYKGRIGVFEILKQAQTASNLTLQQACLNRIAEGITTKAEMQRVITGYYDS